MRLCLLLCTILVMCGCGDDSPDPLLATQAKLDALREPSNVSEVVAKVGEHAITVQAFEYAWSLHPEWTRKQVLEELVRRELLWSTITSDAVATKPLNEARRRGMVDAMLQAEVAASPAKIKQEDVDAKVAYVSQRRVRPAGYRASHLLVRLPEGSADDALAKATLQRLAAALRAQDKVTAGDLLRVLSQLENETSDGFTVVVNANMKMTLNGVPKEILPEGWVNVVAPFAQGAKQVVAERGLDALSEPVKTSFGWHVITVHERYERQDIPREELERAVRRDMRQAAHQSVVFERLEPLFKAYTWSTDPTALSDDMTGQTTDDKGSSE